MLSEDEVTAGAAVHHHLVLTGVTLSISPPSPLCLLNKLSVSLWHVSSSTAASPKTTRPDSRETGATGCITTTYYDDEMSYKTPNTLLEKSLLR